jgi:23S rRNA G2445 N2-methylase RlmL
VERMDVREFMGVEPAGHVVTNPPYGVRISRGDDFETSVAKSLCSLHGHRISAICHDARLAQAMGRAPAQEHTLFNGDLECRLYSWDIA